MLGHLLLQRAGILLLVQAAHTLGEWREVITYMSFKR